MPVSFIREIFAQLTAIAWVTVEVLSLIRQFVARLRLLSLASHSARGSIRTRPLGIVGEVEAGLLDRLARRKTAACFPFSIYTDYLSSSLSPAFLIAAALLNSAVTSRGQLFGNWAIPLRLFSGLIVPGVGSVSDYVAIGIMPRGSVRFPIRFAVIRALFRRFLIPSTQGPFSRQAVRLLGQLVD